MIRVGIVGCGYWGPNLIRNLYALRGAQLVWACDVSAKRLEDVHDRYPTIQTTKRYADLLADNSLDAIVIATPTETHFKLASEALRAGKHVLVEKPMTKTVREAQQLVDSAKRNRRILMVDHTFIYSGAVKKMKELIDSGAIGDVLYMDSVRINLGLIRTDTNVVWDLAPHDLSIMMHLLGTRPTQVQAVGTHHIGKKQAEIAYVTLRFPNNVLGHVHVSWLSPVKVRDALIGGTKKMLRYDDVEPTEKVKIYDHGVRITPEMKRGETPFTPLYRAGSIVIPKLDQTEALLNETKHFIECIRNKKKPLTDGAAGLAVVSILEATDKSLRSKGKEITL